MAQYFFINQHSELPILEMRLIENGRYGSIDHEAFYIAIQNAEIYFTMIDIDTGVTRVAHQAAGLLENIDCPGTYNMYYQFKKRDTQRVGSYRGQFEIAFGSDLKNEFTNRNLIVPIHDSLIINVISDLIKK
jgi:hypothetical protein